MNNLSVISDRDKWSIVSENKSLAWVDIGISDIDKVVEIPYLYTLMPHRNKGLATTLLTRLIEYYTGYKFVLLAATRDLIPFYERLGFIIDEENNDKKFNISMTRR